MNKRAQVLPPGAYTLEGDKKQAFIGKTCSMRRVISVKEKTKEEKDSRKCHGMYGPMQGTLQRGGNTGLTEKVAFE